MSSGAFSQAAVQLREAPTPQARQEAVRSLRQAAWRGPQAFDALSSSMLSDLSNEVRRDAAVALLDYEGYEALRRLEVFFKGEQGEATRRAVCAVLSTAPAHLDDRGATTLLTGLLAEDPAATVRLAAAEGLARRGDVSAVGGLRQAAQKDADPAVRAAAAAAQRRLAHPPQARPPKPKKPQRAPYDAVKGKDRCPLESGWCECSRPPVRTRSRCLPRADCAHTYFNSYRPQGFTCTWNGELIE